MGKRYLVLLLLLISLLLTACDGVSLFDKYETTFESALTTDTSPVSTNTEDTTSITPAPTESSVAEETSDESLPDSEALVYGNISFYYDMMEDVYADENDGTELVYAQIQNISIDIEGQPAVTETINDALSQISADRIADYEFMCVLAQGGYIEGGMELIVAPYEYLAYTEPTYISDSFLSFYVLDYQYLGGAHGGSIVQGLSFDLATGEPVTIESISDQPDAFLNFIEEHIINQIIEMPEDERPVFNDFETTIPNEMEHTAILFTNAEEPSIVVVFQEYSIGPYSSATPTFLIPISECETYLRDEAKILFEPDDISE